MAGWCRPKARGSPPPLAVAIPLRFLSQHQSKTMDRSDFHRDPERVVDAPEDSYPGTSHWVCNVETLIVDVVTHPDGNIDPCFTADSLWELLGKVRHAKHTRRLSEYAADHFEQHIISEIDRVRRKTV